jgi:hypothetical protein
MYGPMIRVSSQSQLMKTLRSGKSCSSRDLALASGRSR